MAICPSVRYACPFLHLSSRPHPHGAQIFVERKTHREDWTGEKSVKARFAIKEDKVNAFLRGEITMDDEFAELVRKGKKTAAEVESMAQLANEVQYAVLTRKLRPGAPLHVNEEMDGG